MQTLTAVILNTLVKIVFIAEAKVSVRSVKVKSVKYITHNNYLAYYLAYYVACLLGSN